MIAGLFFFAVADSLAYWHFMKRCANGPVGRVACEVIWQIEVVEPEDVCPDSEPVIVNGVQVGCTGDKTNYRGII